MTDYTGATAIVIGGSIGGLTAALLLRDLGFTVDVFERTATALDGRGSGIVLQPDTVRWFTERSAQNLADLSTSTSYVQYLDRSGDLRRRGVPGAVHLDLHLMGHLLPGPARRFQLVLGYRALPLR
jgi:2,6-dihydroxypyridine 3-monooxygenase